MLELCFSQSARGGLRCAQHCGGGGRKVFGVIVGRDDGRPATRKEIRQAQKQAQQKREARTGRPSPWGERPRMCWDCPWAWRWGTSGSPWGRSGTSCSGSGTMGRTVPVLILQNGGPSHPNK